MSWLQPEDSSKKSFLIRDILANSSSNYRSDVFNWVLSQHANLQWNNSNLFDLADKNESNHKNGKQVSTDGNLNDNSPNSSTAASLINPIVENWLENNVKANQCLLDVVNEMPKSSLINNLTPTLMADQLTDQFESKLYENLCYYAIQQQINATVICRSANNANLLANSTVPGQQTSAKNIVKAKKRKPTLKNSTNSIGKCRTGAMKTFTNNNNHSLVNKSSKNKFSKTNKNNNNLDLIINLSNNILNEQKEPQQLKCVDNNLNEDDDSDNLATLPSIIQQASNNFRETKYRKIRRNRTVFTELQLMGLERRFDSQKYLSTPDRTDLARALGLTQLQVKTWYQNRRMKWKKQVMQNGCPYPPTKPKGRPKKDSIPTYGLEFTNSILCPIIASKSEE